MITFGSRLKSLRQKKGLTQRELAKLIGAKHNSISDWENDGHKPDMDTIERLMGVFEVSSDYLLARDNPVVYRTNPIQSKSSGSTCPTRLSKPATLFNVVMTGFVFS